jgi:amidase
MASQPPQDALTELGAVELGAALRARRFSCREAMRAYLERIEALNPAVNAIVSLQPAERLLTQADACDAELARGENRGPLHGFPLAIKDMAATAGVRTTLGSALADHVPVHDGLMVARMRRAGAIVIGKTNTPEFGLGSHTYNALFGITRNAWDMTRTAGGSSGGGAVSLALRLQPVADGSDMMGSLRNPAAFNNVFGLRPSFGRVPAGPLGDQFVNQLSTEGPMGRSVRDVALLLRVQAGYDARAPLSIAEGGEAFALPLAALEMRGQRIGWLRDLQGYLPMEAGIVDVCEAGLRRLEAIGGIVEPATLGYPPERVWRTWLTWRRWLVAGRLAAFFDDPAQRGRLKPEARWEAEQGAGLSGAEVFAASAERTAFYHRLLALFERHDFLALPSAQVWPFDADWHWPRSINGVAMDTYHRWMEVVIYATLGGLPAISVPAGFNAAGLPMGLQLIGRPQGDLALLQLAARYEETIGELLARRPSAVTPRP